jgi:hypothetical protein
VAPRDFERLLNVLRDGSGRIGVTSARSRELAWGFRSLGQRLDVSVVPERGMTTIRISQSVRRSAFNGMAASIVGMSAIVAPAVGGLLAQLMFLRGPVWMPRLAEGTIIGIAVSTGIAVAATSIPLGRRLVRYLANRSARDLDALADAVVAKTKEAIEDEAPRRD